MSTTASMTVDKWRIRKVGGPEHVQPWLVTSPLSPARRVRMTWWAFSFEHAVRIFQDESAQLLMELERHA